MCRGGEAWRCTSCWFKTLQPEVKSELKKKTCEKKFGSIEANPLHPAWKRFSSAQRMAVGVFCSEGRVQSKAPPGVGTSKPQHTAGEQASAVLRHGQHQVK